ncbi:MFS transporter [Rhodobacteraceae bacterium CCMM004]|nr:MFS transporter [Rhodobacteraceae bacterium CCMM004]
MRLLISFAALFLSVVLLQLGAGGIAPLDAISGLAAGFTRAEVGLLGSAHFLGFFIGCWWAPRLMGAIGHSRAFAAFTAMGTIGILAHVLIVGPWAWAGLRVMSGLCVAGAYTVIESWLQSKVTNATRGRAMGTYRMVDMAGSLMAQLLIGVLEPGAYVSYVILSLFCCAALLPLTLTRLSQPETPEAPRLRPGLAWSRSPLAVAGVVVSGLTAAAFRMVGPVYGVEVGLSPDRIALFLAAFVAGGALSQVPAGWLADRYDRRWVLIGFSAAGMAACAATVALSTGGVAAVMLGAGLFGLATFPVYSISAAHAHDYADASERVELSAALMFLFALGAIASPYVVSGLIERYGPAAMFAFVAVAHAVLILIGLWRMLRRPSRPPRTAYVATPRTSFLVGRLFGRNRDRAP